MASKAVVVVVVFASLGCSEEPDAPGTADAAASSSGSAAGGAGGCLPGEAPLDDGGCLPAGIPEGECGTGFVSDGARSCDAVLPETACGPGQMAVPGEVACREVAPCGRGTWGDIPVEPTTQHVDAAFAGAVSDGSAEAPWKTIGEAIENASPLAIVAVARGTYGEDVEIALPVRLWGACPAETEILGQGDLSAVLVLDGADGSEIRDIAVSGPAAGIIVDGSSDVTIDRVRVHDVAGRGINVQETLGRTAASVTGTLVERAGDLGIYVGGAEAIIEATTVRDSYGDNGRGINVQSDVARGKRASCTIRGCLVERNVESGVIAWGADVTIESTVVRDTAASDGFTGFGVAVQRDGMTLTEPSVVTIRQSVLERNLGVTLFVEGSEAHVEATVVRDTLPNVELWAGYGFYVHDDEVATPGPNRGTLVVRSSVADRCRSVAVFVAGSDATIESTLVRDTALEGDTGKFGRAIAAQISPATLERASVEVKFCAIERASDAGVVAIGSDALVEATRITDTMATALGTYGDGVSVSTAQFTDAPGSMTIAGLLIEKSARAGISTFGASAKVSDTAFDCNGIDINAEAIAGIEPDLVNAGGNTCGCEEAERVCVVSSSMLLPPEPVDSVH